MHNFGQVFVSSNEKRNRGNNALHSTPAEWWEVDFYHFVEHVILDVFVLAVSVCSKKRNARALFLFSTLKGRAHETTTDQLGKERAMADQTHTSLRRSFIIPIHVGNFETASSDSFTF